MHPVYETNQANKGLPKAAVLPPRALAIGLSLIAVLGLAACGDKKGEQEKAQAAAHAQIPEVGVITVALQDVAIVSDLPGRLEALRVAQVRARAAGIVQKRLFQEGSDVKAGQLLFQIDNTPYKANLQSAQATLAQAEAALAQASSVARRYKPLVEANAISKQEYDTAIANEKAAQAQVAAGKAAVTNANVNLGYAAVTSPISGRIGRALVTEGALVGQGEATQLATVQQINPIYVNFTQSSDDVFRLRRALQDGKLQKIPGTDAAKVKIMLSDGTPYSHDGKLLFADLTVDPTSGQVTLRAEVPNPQAALLPGLYVRVRIEQAQVSNAALLPQQAVTRTEQGNSVSIVSDDGKITKRSITINGTKDNQWIVTDGLKAGEKVQVDGFQKLQMMPPGTPVKPVEWSANGSKPAPAGAGKDAGKAAPAPAAPAAGGNAETKK
ncbi:MexX family efflux pump subunit [Comamonas phosphati]|nr:MexX family efflux pump subunit [Comamonas phosphati]